MQFDVLIRSPKDTQERKVLVEAANWMLALRRALEMVHEEPISPGTTVCEILGKETVLVTDKRLNRSIQVQERVEDSAGPEEIGTATLTYLEAQMNIEEVLEEPSSLPDATKLDLPFFRISTREKELMGLVRPKTQQMEADEEERRQVQYFSVVKVDLTKNPLDSLRLDRHPDALLEKKKAAIMARLQSLQSADITTAATVLLQSLLETMRASGAWLLVKSFQGQLAVLATAGLAQGRGSLFLPHPMEAASMTLSAGIGISLSFPHRTALRPFLMEEELWSSCGGLICVPLDAAGKTVGVIQIHRQEGIGEGFSQDELLLLEHGSILGSELLSRFEFRPCVEEE